MLSSLTSPENPNLFGLALARGVLVAGLGMLGVYILQAVVTIPTEPAFGAAVLLGGVVFFQDLSVIFKELEKVWKAEQRARAKQLRFEASLFGGGWLPAEPDDDEDPAEPELPPSETGPRVTIGHPNGAYTQPVLSAAERAEMDAIGDGLRFLAIAGRAEGLSLRVMQTCRPANFSKSQFEKWWHHQTDQLAYWGILEKADRQTTRYAARYPDIQSARRALTHREFRRHPLPPRGADRQTDSQTAPEAGQGGGIFQPATQ